MIGIRLPKHDNMSDEQARLLAQSRRYGAHINLIL